MKGIFHVTVNRAGVDIVDTQFENMILGSGWEHMMTFTPPDRKTPFINTVFLGDGEVPAAYEDTTLSGETVAEIQYTAFQDSQFGTGGNYAWAGYRNYATLTFTGVSTTQAPIREISVGWKDSNKTTLFSRTLLRDNDNQPITAWVAPGDSITITYFLYFGANTVGSVAKGAAPYQIGPRPSTDETSLLAGIADRIAATWIWDGIAFSTVRSGATHSTKVINIDHTAKTFDVVIEVIYSAGATITNGYDARYITFDMLGLSYRGVAFSTYTRLGSNIKYTYTARFKFGIQWPEVLNYFGPTVVASQISKYSHMTRNTYYQPFYPVYASDSMGIVGSNRSGQTYDRLLSDLLPGVTSFTRPAYVANDIMPNLIMPATHVYRNYKTGDVITPEHWRNGFTGVLKWSLPEPHKLLFSFSSLSMDSIDSRYDMTINGRVFKWYYNYRRPDGTDESVYGGAIRNDDNTGWIPINIGDVIKLKLKKLANDGYYDRYLPREFELTVPQHIERFIGKQHDFYSDVHTPPVNFRPVMDVFANGYSFFTGFYGE